MRAFLALIAVAGAVQLKSQDATEVNPIRRIVNLLHKMQEEVQAEGEKEQELFDKFTCYCKNGDAKLKADIAAGLEAGKQMKSDADSKAGRKSQLDAEVAQARADRTEAQAAVDKASGIRSKERKDFEESSADMAKNHAAMESAIAAIRKGTAAAFIQAPNAMSNLHRAVAAASGAADMEKDLVFSFLTQGESASAPSDEIVGIVSSMKDSLAKDIEDAKSHESDAVKGFSEMSSAKNAEIAAASAAIEHKVVRAGELAVEVSTLKGQANANGHEVAAAQKELGALAGSCKSKTEEHEASVKSRNDELAAIGEAVKVLNDDDALDIFKKTLPAGGAASFIQTGVPAATEAQAFIQQAMVVTKNRAPALGLISYMLRVGKMDFSKVIKQIDDMVAHLKTEQNDDEDMQAYCEKELNKAGDDKKALTRDVKDADAAVGEANANIEQAQASLKELAARVADTQASMKAATEQRQAENAVFKQTQVELGAAKQLLEVAKNKLNKFYNPTMYKEAPKRVLTEEEKIAVANGAPMPTNAPEFIPGTNIRSNLLQKNKKAGGVIGLMDMMIKDVVTQTKEGAMAEETAQSDYENLMGDAKESLAADGASQAETASGLASQKENLSTAEGDRRAKGAELAATNTNIGNLHGECDFILDNFDARKEARTNEIEALKNGKAVLSGANFN